VTAKAIISETLGRQELCIRRSERPVHQPRPRHNSPSVPQCLWPQKLCTSSCERDWHCPAWTPSEYMCIQHLPRRSADAAWKSSRVLAEKTSAHVGVGKFIWGRFFASPPSHLKTTGCWYTQSEAIGSVFPQPPPLGTGSNSKISPQATPLQNLELSQGVTEGETSPGTQSLSKRPFASSTKDQHSLREATCESTSNQLC
jgi:hypothetical protein